MAVIPAKRSESSGEFERKQVVRLTRGLYGGMLSRYTLPKMVKKYNSDEEEAKVFLSFVVTHDRTNEKLANFSEAFVGVRPTLFYDPKTGKKSNYAAVVYALLGGKVPFEAIAPLDQDVAPHEFDWDDLVGRPAILFIEPSAKADKNGLYSNKVTSIEPADKGLIAAIKPIYAKRELDVTKDSSLTYMKFPVPVFEDIAEAKASNDDGGPSWDDLDEEPPF